MSRIQSGDNMVSLEEEDEISTSDRSPLLSGIQTSNETLPKPALIPQLHSPRYVVVVVAAVIFILMFGSFLQIAPTIRIFEDIICHHYYDRIQGEGHISLSGKIDEGLCKGDEVQEELAIVIGGVEVGSSVPGNTTWHGTVHAGADLIIGVLLAFPFGILGDR